MSSARGALTTRPPAIRCAVARVPWFVRPTLASAAVRRDSIVTEVNQCPSSGRQAHVKLDRYFLR